MANVLPPDAKKRLANVYQARFISMISLSLIVAGMLSIIALAPSYILLAVQSGNATDTPTADDATVRTDMTRSQGLLKQFAQIATSTPAFDALQSITTHRPSGISIDQIDYTPAAGNKPGTILVTGTGSGRDPINTYLIALQAQGRFSNVSVPVSALAGADQGRFIMTITGTF